MNIAVIIIPTMIIIFVIGNVIAIASSKRRSKYGSRLSFALLALFAPIIILLLSAWPGIFLPEWLQMTIFIIGVISPYIVRSVFVFTPQQNVSYKCK